MRKIIGTVVLMIVVFIGAKYMSKQSWAAAYAWGIGCLYIALDNRNKGPV
jgi:hypothetical protein